MNWYRILPKCGNKRYLFIDRANVSEETLKNVKLISCWYTSNKPSSKKEVNSECLPYIVVKKRKLKSESKNFDVDTYATLQCLCDLVPTKYGGSSGIIENGNYSYLVINNSLKSFQNMKFFHEKVLNELFKDVEFRGCQYCLEIPPDIFLKINRLKYSEKFNQDIKITAKNLGSNSEYLERAVTEKKEALKGKVKPLNAIIFQRIFETVQGKTYTDLFFENKFMAALQNCRFLSEQFRQNPDFFANQPLQNFFLTAGDQGKNYLLLQLCKNNASIFSSTKPVERSYAPHGLSSDRVMVTIAQIIYAPKLKPIRCSKQAPWCDTWCGAYSPVELIGRDFTRPSHFSYPTPPVELSTLADKFIQSLPQRRLIFRTSELQSWLPKTIRSPFDVSCIIDYLIRCSLIAPFGSLITNFKPGKKSNVYIVLRGACRSAI